MEKERYSIPQKMYKAAQTNKISEKNATKTIESVKILNNM
jgi:hypothetical protein